MGKGENAGYQHCLLFQQYFLQFLQQLPIFESFCLSYAIWTSLKFCDLLKGVCMCVREPLISDILDLDHDTYAINSQVVQNGVEASTI